MKYNARLRRLIEKHEGRVAHAYTDSLGYLTIGIGHLVDQRKGGSLPDEIINAIFDYDLNQVEAAMPDWMQKLDEVRKAVLTDMFFNLGPEPFDGDGYKDWPIFIKQIKEGKYAEAATNMRATLWAKQVKGRALRLAEMMESGEWPSDV